MSSNIIENIDDALSEPSDSSVSYDSDLENLHTNDVCDNNEKQKSYFVSNDYKNDENVNNFLKRVRYNKLTYNDVKKHVNKYYDLDFVLRYSSALDILSSYLKGQKFLYMQANYYTIFILYNLMIPSIAITAFCTVAQSPMEHLVY